MVTMDNYRYTNLENAKHHMSEELLSDLLEILLVGEKVGAYSGRNRMKRDHEVLKLLIHHGVVSKQCKHIHTEFVLATPMNRRLVTPSYTHRQNKIKILATRANRCVAYVVFSDEELEQYLGVTA
jgi:hypothetical protein